LGNFFNFGAAKKQHPWGQNGLRNTNFVNNKKRTPEIVAQTTP